MALFAEITRVAPFKPNGVKVYYVVKGSPIEHDVTVTFPSEPADNPEARMEALVAQVQQLIAGRTRQWAAMMDDMEIAAKVLPGLKVEV